MSYGLSILTSAGLESIDEVYSARFRHKFELSIPNPPSPGYTTGQRINWSYSSLNIGSGDAYEYDPTKDIWYIGRKFPNLSYDNRWNIVAFESWLFKFVPFSSFFFFDHANAQCSFIFDYGTNTTVFWTAGTYVAEIQILRIKA